MSNRRPGAKPGKGKSHKGKSDGPRRSDSRGDGRPGKSGGRSRAGQSKNRPPTGSQRGTTPMRDKPSHASPTRRRPLGGDQIEGRQAVRELLLAGNRRAREIVMAADMETAPILEEILELANEDRIPIRELSKAKFDAFARTESSQGVVALAPPLLEHDLETFVKPRNGIPPFLLVVDGVTDPGNLGSLLRIAECAGVTGVILARHRAVHITPTVTKTAAGAIEHLPITQVTGIPSAIGQLNDLGVWTVGLDMGGDSSVFDLRVATDPVALVLGAEGRGISRLARERCEVVATIPLAGNIDSLNVAAAGAVACFEVVRRRQELGDPQ